MTAKFLLKQEQGGEAAEPAPQSRTEALKDQIDEVTDVMKVNIEKILEREDKLDNLSAKAQEMRNEVSPQQFNAFTVVFQKVGCWTHDCWLYCAVSLRHSSVHVPQVKISRGRAAHKRICTSLGEPSHYNLLCEVHIVHSLVSVTSP
ncbi:hypothetical protein INR49_016722 [Caranx melampygus]|nr:hypothetical protein INR49_016722 [Caranx melampygus]